MAAKEKVIGFKVFEESNLVRRLKMVVRRTGLNYGELLEKWVSGEEANFESLFNQPTAPAPQDLKLAARIAELEEKIETLMSAKQEVPNPALTSEPEEVPVSEIAEQPGQVGTKVSTSEKELKGYEVRIMELSKLTNELTGKKFSTREIAAKLEAEGIKTPKGEVKWQYGTVAKIIKRNS